MKKLIAWLFPATRRVSGIIKRIERDREALIAGADDLFEQNNADREVIQKIESRIRVRSSQSVKAVRLAASLGNLLEANG